MCSLYNILSKKTTALLGGCFRCWHLPIFPGRHHPSIFGTIELNFRVRHGNGWTLDVINTNFIAFNDFVIIPCLFNFYNIYIKKQLYNLYIFQKIYKYKIYFIHLVYHCLFITNRIVLFTTRKAFLLQ